MQIVLNGENFTVETLNLHELLVQQGVGARRVAVVVNGRPVPLAERDGVMLQAGDRVDLITLAGGG